MKKLISTLVVLALVAFVAFKAAVWWFADQDLRQARTALEELGVMERGTIHSSLAGQLSLHQASYQDFRLTQPLQVTRLTVDAGSPLALVTALVDPRRLPATWEAKADGFRLGLDANMFRSWVASAENATPALFAPPCGPDVRQRLSSGELLRLGISNISGDAVLRQRVSGLHLEINTDNTGSLEVDWPGARLSLTEPQALLASTSSALTLTLRDGGILRTIAAFCSREMGLSVDEWSARAGGLFRQQLALTGYQPSEQLLALYRRWLSDGGELTLTLDPASATYGVPVRTGDDEGASLAVQYNGAGVPEVFLQPLAEEVIETANDAVPPAGAAPQLSSAPGWRTRALAEAGQWRGHRVRVTLRNGRQVEGRLDVVSDSQLDVARPVDGGEVVYPLARSSVSGFEVWQRGSDTSDR